MKEFRSDSKFAHAEKELLDAFARAVKKRVPLEPCPDDVLLKRIARPNDKHGQIDQWVLTHVGTCSRCIERLRELRAPGAIQVFGPLRRPPYALIFGFAALLIAISVLLVWRTTHREPPVMVVVDLRDKLVLRGLDQGTSTQQPIELGRAIVEASVYLPSGSTEGEYQIGVFRTGQGQALTETTGTAGRDGENTVLRVRLNLSKMKTGDYLLGVRAPASGWRFYAATVR